MALRSQLTEICFYRNFRTKIAYGPVHRVCVCIQVFKNGILNKAVETKAAPRAKRLANNRGEEVMLLDEALP